MRRELGIDRVELRNRNLIPKEKMPYDKRLKNRAGVSSIIDSGDYLACSNAALAAIDYAGFVARQQQARADGRYLGLGFAHAVKPTGRGPFESALVRVSPAGRISVFTGALAMGQGLATALAQVCAEQLGVAIEDDRRHRRRYPLRIVRNGRVREPAGDPGRIRGADRGA